MKQSVDKEKNEEILRVHVELGSHFLRLTSAYKDLSRSFREGEREYVSRLINTTIDAIEGAHLGRGGKDKRELVALAEDSGLYLANLIFS
jgi:hypothetical protein